MQQSNQSTVLPPLNWQALDNLPVFILLETNKFSDEENFSYLFLEPDRIIKATGFDEIPSVLNQLNELANNYFLAGYLAYETGAFWHSPLKKRSHAHLPLIWFGVFTEAVIFNHKTGQFNKNIDRLLASTDSSGVHDIRNIQFAINRHQYQKKIKSIKSFIEAGDTYQVNFTSKYCFDFAGSPFSLYHELKEKQQVAYNAFLKFENNYVISISPELYFRKLGKQMIAKPMKGTLARGRTVDEDSQQAQLLANDSKNRSENVMIVDLMRNDFGRMAKIGSVEVPALFTVEKYNSLFQMTSTVKCELRDGIGWTEIFRNLFPAGSVTGAPKLRTMEIIQELEEEPRGIYTGAIGFIAPGGDACFNVPIRTVTLCDGAGEMGVGSGIVYDSDPNSEYDECRLKARFLVEQFQQFYLIETMLWQEGFCRLPLHLARLRDSAAYFDYKCDLIQIETELGRIAESFSVGGRYKVRLLLSQDGIADVSFSELHAVALDNSLVTISSKRTHSSDRFLFHKTSLRVLYDEEFKKHTARGFADVLFMNENDEITEGAISNIFIEKDGIFYTPPVECGLLAGVFRQEFLRNHSTAKERPLRLDDLTTARAIYLTNSVRGMIKVRLDFSA